jgi:tetratricopeptide (TPR) repeat protein
MAEIKLETGKEITLTNALDVAKRYRLVRMLGAGQTSVVWTADEVDDANHKVRTVALKVLKSESDAKWRYPFEREASLLRELREREGGRVIPELYDWSKPGATPAFLAMEYIPFPSVEDLALPNSQLPKDARRLRESVNNLSLQVTNLFKHLNILSVIPGDLIEPIKRLEADVRRAELDIPRLAIWLERWDSGNRGLSSSEVVEIGYQVSRMLQAVHDAHRSYSDFQLINIHWDRDNKRAKVIDWNVVTEVGVVRPQIDTLHLARFLFYLRTLAPAPESGASLVELSRLGGRLWQDTSLALRIVLEKALSPEPERRFASAYSRLPAEKVIPLSATASLGEALEQIARYEKEELRTLYELASRCMQDNLPDDALAVISIARPRLQNGNVYSKSLLDIEQAALEKSGLDDFLKGKRHFERQDYQRARECLQRAIQKSPDNLDAYRWLELTKACGRLNPDKFFELWNQGDIQKGMESLAQGRYDEAIATLGNVGIDLAVLLADARINKSLQDVNCVWQKVSQVHDPLVMEQLLQPSRLDQPNLLQQMAHQIEDFNGEHYGQIPYINELLRNWPDLNYWRDEIKKVQDMLRHITEAREGVKAAFKSGDYKKGLDSLRDSLQDSPGDIEMLRIALEQADICLLQGNTQEAIGILELSLKYVSDSSFYDPLWSRLKLAQAWQGAREAVRERVLSGAIDLLEQLGDRMPKDSHALKKDLNDWFQLAVGELSLDTALRLSVLESKIFTAPPERQADIEGIRKRLNDREKDQNKKLREKVAALLQGSLQSMGDDELKDGLNKIEETMREAQSRLNSLSAEPQRLSGGRS